MTKQEITEIQAAFARLSTSLVTELPSLEAHLRSCMQFATCASHPLHEQDMEAVCKGAADMERACRRLRDLEILQREFEPLLDKIAWRINQAEERLTEQQRWTHAVVAHCLGGEGVWVYAGTLTDCMRHVEELQVDEGAEEYSVHPMGVLESGQKLAARKARRRLALDPLDEDIPF